MRWNGSKGKAFITSCSPAASTRMPKRLLARIRKSGAQLEESSSIDAAMDEERVGGAVWTLRKNDVICGRGDTINR
jgi:hypothetical protein